MKKLLLFLMFLTTISTQAQLFEGFEGAVFPPPGWAIADNGIGTAHSWTTNSSANTGALAAYINRENVTNGTFAEDWLITSQVTVPTNGQVRFFTKLSQAGNQGSTYRVLLSTASQTNFADFTTVLQDWTETTLMGGSDLPAQTTYIQKFVTIPAAFSGQQVYIAFVNINDNGDRWFIDDVNVDQQCLANTALAATPLSTSATLSWTSPGAATQWEIEYGPVGFVQGAGTTVSPVTTNPYNLTGLTPLTAYSFYVRSLCGTGNNSTWTGPFNFTTSSAPPVCGGNFVDSGGVTGNYPNSADEIVTICPTNPGEIVIVTFTNFNTEATWDALYVFDGNSITSPQISSTNGAENVPGGLAGGFWGTTIPGPFEATSAGGCLTFRFRSDSSGQRAGWTANVTCIPAPTCPKPAALVFSAISSTSATVNWTENGTATQWEVLRLPAGSPAPTAASTGVITTTKPYVFTGLTSQTSYDVYVRAICTPATDISLWSPIGTFTTSPNFCAGDIFYDQGGATGNYPNNSDYIITICADNPGDVITVDFTAFNTEANWDALYVYDGNSITAPQIASTNDAGNVPGGLAGGFWGTTLPDAFEATSASGCLTFRFRSDGSGQRAGWAATVTCAPPPTCRKPSNLVVSTVTGSTASVNWTENGTATQWEVLTVPAGSPAPTAASTGVITSVKPYTITGLSSQTAYDVYVRAICIAGTDISVWSKKATFETSPNFCAGDIFYDQGGATGNYPNSSNYTVTICPDNPGDVVKVTFNSFNTEANWDALYVYDGDSAASPQIASTNGAANVPGGVAGGFWGTTIPGPFEASGPSGCLTFVFRSDSFSNRAGWDASVICRPPPTCPKPFNLTATAINSTSATLGWTDGGTATNWQILIVPFGSPAPGPTSLGIPTTLNPYIATGLNPGIRYTYYVRALCSAIDKSDWTAFSFSTKPVNDDCANAISVPVNTNLTCVQSVTGTLTGATASSQANSCPGNANDDVWYTFIASASAHIVSVENETNFDALAFGVYSGANCNALTQVLCVDNDSGLVNNLIIGQQYYIRLFSYTAPVKNLDFTLCIGTVPCSEAVPFCSSQVLTFPNTTNVPQLGELGCLYTSPNATFFFLQVSQAGQLNYLMTQSTTAGGPANLDVDYALWGPFASNAIACQSVPNNNPLTCSYSINATETFSITGQVCQVYVLMITNYANQPGFIQLTQTNAATGGQTICNPFNAFNYSAFEYCQDAPNQLPILVNGATAGTYTATPAGLVIDSVTGEVNVAASLPGSYTISSTTTAVTNGTCPALNDIVTSRIFRITEASTATIAYSDPVYCNSNSTQNVPTMTGTTGGTYSVTPAGLAIDTINGIITASISQPGVYTVTYSLPAIGGCPAFSTTTQVEILAGPQITFQPNVNSCGTYTLLPLTVGDYYTGANATGNQLPAGTEITSAQTIYIYATNSICTSEESFTVTINSVPDPTITILTQPTCASPTGSIEVTSPVLVSGTVPTNLFISEITDEDTGSLTYVELFNGTSAPINLANYKLKVYNNGNATTSPNCDITLSGTIPVNTTYVIKLSTSPNVGGVTPNISYTACAGVNIDDSIVLTTNANVVLDTWGTNGTVFTPAGAPGYTYRRLASAATLPSATFNAADWTALDPQDYTDVGSYVLLASTYEYSVDAGAFQNTPIFSGLASGTHVLVVKDLITGCESAPFTFTINAVATNPQITTFTYAQPFCEDDAVNPIPDVSATGFATGGIFSATPSGLSIDASSGEIDLATSLPGIYQVTYAVLADLTNCLGASQSTFDVTIAPTPVAVIVQGCVATNYEASVNPDVTANYDPATATYQWFNSLNTSIGTASSVVIKDVGAYSVVVTTAAGCSDTFMFTVNAIDCSIPKGISPNGDGLNDEFDLSNFNVQALKIFNRYGKEVYSNGNYSNQWKGQSSNGNELPDATYYYTISLKDGKVLTGWVYINR